MASLRRVPSIQMFRIWESLCYEAGWIIYGNNKLLIFLEWCIILIEKIDALLFPLMLLLEKRTKRIKVFTRLLIKLTSNQLGVKTWDFLREISGYLIWNGSKKLLGFTVVIVGDARFPHDIHDWQVSPLWSIDSPGGITLHYIHNPIWLWFVRCSMRFNGNNCL